jgi:hypothetical protein
MSIKRTVAKGKIDLAENFTLPATDSVILGDTSTFSSILSGKANVGSPVFTGNVGIGTTTNTTRMALDIVSTSAMLLPAGTIAQRPATGIKGLLRYNTEDNVFEGFSGSWLTLGSAVTTPVGITGVTVSGNSWIVTTNNASGALGVHVTFADDPVVYTAVHNPTMTGASTIAADTTNWPATIGDNTWSATALSKRDNSDNQPWQAFTLARGGPGQWNSGEDFIKTSGNPKTGKVGSWIQLKYPARYIMESFNISYSNGLHLGKAIAWTLQGSNDNSIFTNIESYTIPSTDDGEFTTACDVKNLHIPYMYWRVLITKTDPSDTNAYAAGSEHLSCGVDFYTIASNVKVGNAFQKNTTQFEIDIVDYAGYPVNIATGASNKFNILLIKDGKVVTEGLYTFSAAAGSATKAD